MNKAAINPQLAYEYLDRALLLLKKQRPASGQSNSWIQGREAVDEQQHSCAPYDERAVAWCEIGAVRATTHYDDEANNTDAAYRYVISLLNMANPNILAYGSIPGVNDSHKTTFDTVVRMFEKAKYLAIRFGAQS